MHVRALATRAREALGSYRSILSPPASDHQINYEFHSRAGRCSDEAYVYGKQQAS